MRKAIILLLTVLLGTAVLADQPARFGKLLSRKYPSMSRSDSAVVVVYLKDKGVGVSPGLFSAGDLLSPRSIARRAKARPEGNVIDERDLPVDRSYIETIARNTVEVRHALKWFNAVSAVATREQIDAIGKLNFVKEIELVGRWRLRPEPEEPGVKNGDNPARVFGTGSLDYGSSITQNAQIGVTAVHDLGVYGEGVVVCVLDNGFRLLSHEAFDSMNIIAQYDFVDKKVSVIPSNPVLGSHGVNTLSTIGGYAPGQLIGPAFRADYILARTENDSSETPFEEDNWVAAIEWADSIGVDVTSTSLGYLGYDIPYPGWTWQDMDGNTTLITRAADHAVSLGIVVVNSAGNEGVGDSTNNTLVAPSDGDSVIAAGAVSSTGERASFSSVGPTTDVPARIKPDIMAMGVSVRVASSSNPVGYGSANGTSFSCPLSAGVAALILSANPALGPLQVRDAMRNTADNAASPNNLYGWGILNADSALKYWGIVPMAKISGVVYHDLDGNGTFDGIDTLIPGRTVLLTGTRDDSIPSGSGGNYEFDTLAIGTYTISTTLPAGWIITTPPESLTFDILHRDTLSGISTGIFQS